VLRRFGSPQRAERNHLAVRLDEGSAELADVVRALDAEQIPVRELEIHAPTLDDVFLAKTGRRLEGAAKEGEESAAESTGELEAVPA
jgi:ABC-2 type transport system ATP-binding protein